MVCPHGFLKKLKKKDGLPTCPMAILVHADSLEVDVSSLFVICSVQCCHWADNLCKQKGLTAADAPQKPAVKAAVLRKADHLHWLLNLLAKQESRPAAPHACAPQGQDNADTNYLSQISANSALPATGRHLPVLTSHQCQSHTACRRPQTPLLPARPS